VDGAFDLIVFDPPFRWFAPRDLREAAMTDRGYRAMTEFFTRAKRHLTGTARMLIFFGTSGDLAYLRHLIAQVGLVAEVVAHEDLVREDQRVDYYVFRVTG
jgi:release factor glutamine methyltransferase